MQISTPVALFIFNRPDLTKIVFDRIAQVKPKKLLVVADGPRPDRLGEEEKCKQTRSIVDLVDWDCDVLTNFSAQNLCCGKRVSSGLHWVFSEVEEAIVLEDDILPTPSFFNFCQVLLERYRDDERIMHISGDNSLNQKRNEHSYYFSKYAHIWGWASWRRAWQHYDYSIKSWADFKHSNLLAQVCDSPYEHKFWTGIFDQMHEDPQIKDTWDYQWMYTCLSQGGLAIEPNRNLISNLGFNRLDSAHATGYNSRSKLETDDIWEIIHPPFTVRDREADSITFDNIFDSKKLKKMDTPLGKLRQQLSLIKRSLATA